jgi:hypothetical protein
MEISKAEATAPPFLLALAVPRHHCFKPRVEVVDLFLNALFVHNRHFNSVFKFKTALF